MRSVRAVGLLRNPVSVIRNHARYCAVQFHALDGSEFLLGGARSATLPACEYSVTHIYPRVAGYP